MASNTKVISKTDSTTFAPGRHPTRKNKNGLIIAGFRRLRKYIAEKVSPKEIYMEWYFMKDGVRCGGVSNTELIQYSACDSAACLVGHNAVAFGTPHECTVRDCNNFAIKTLGTDEIELVNVHYWPVSIRDKYLYGTARQKKAAVLSRLDRIIKRGDLH